MRVLITLMTDVRLGALRHRTEKEILVAPEQIRLLNEHGDFEVCVNRRYYSYRAAEIVDVKLLKR